jgi:hypothetical protein
MEARPLHQLHGHHIAVVGAASELTMAANTGPRLNTRHEEYGPPSWGAL